MSRRPSPSPKTPLPIHIKPHPTSLVRSPALYAQVPALDPAALDAQAQAAVEQLLQAGASRNTTRAYASALKYWAGWYRLRYRRAFQLPVPAPAVQQFIVDHVEHEAAAAAAASGRGRLGRARGASRRLVHGLPPAIDAALVEAGFKARLGALSLATIHHGLSVHSVAHKQRQLPNPTRDPPVQALLTGTRRDHAARDVRPAAKDALPRGPRADARSF